MPSVGEDFVFEAFYQSVRYFVNVPFETGEDFKPNINTLDLFVDAKFLGGSEVRDVEAF